MPIFKSGAAISEKRNNYNALADVTIFIANFFKDLKNYDSSSFYARQSLQAATNMHNPLAIARSSMILSENFEIEGRIDSAYKYLVTATNLKDTVMTVEKLKQAEMLLINESERQREIAEVEKNRLIHLKSAKKTLAKLEKDGSA
ncbi:MAG: hypothetical protein JNK79_03395 [Chitinophagaceae bacterium]|nr:hypothetical protein [Chitinophagaceae bacterium]